MFDRDRYNYTFNLLKAHPSTKDVYEVKGHELISQKFAANYLSFPRARASKIKQTADMHAAEIGNRLRFSLIQYIQDLYLRSGLDPASFRHVLRQHGCKNTHQNIMNRFESCLDLLESVALRRFGAHFKKKDGHGGTVYHGDAANIIKTVSKSYRLILRNLQSGQHDPESPKSCIVVTQAFQLQSVDESKENDDDEAEEDDEDDDEEDANLSPPIKDQREKPEVPEPEPVNPPAPYSTNNMQRIFTSTLDEENLINTATLNALQQHIKQFQYEKNKENKKNKKNKTHFSYEDVLCLFNGTDVTVSALNNTVHPMAVEHKLNFYTLVNTLAVLAAQNLVDVLAVTYMMYYDTITVYAYIVNSAGYPFGCWLDEQQLQYTIPRLFERCSRTGDIEQFKKDPLLEQCRGVLLGNTKTFLQRVQDAIIAYNQSMADGAVIKEVDMKQVVEIMVRNDIMGENKEYYADERNRDAFVGLLMRSGLCGYFARKLWEKLVESDQEEEECRCAE